MLTPTNVPRNDKPVVVPAPIRSMGIGTALKSAFIAPRDQATLDFQALLDRLN